MIDLKSRAANDPQETSGSRPVTKLILSSGRNLELAMEVIGHLEKKLLISLTAEEKEQWTKELSHISDQKLLKVANEFTGPFLNGIWKFIEDVQVVTETVPEYLKQLPEPISKKGVLCCKAYKEFESGKITAQQYFDKIKKIGDDFER